MELDSKLDSQTLFVRLIVKSRSFFIDSFEFQPTLSLSSLTPPALWTIS